MSVKNPNPTDRHVGQRVRMQRLYLKLSQEKLADGLKLTFQQVQKYEKGTNRIGASRLQQIAQILKVPVSFFFEGAPGGGNGIVAPDYVNKFLATRDGLSLVKSFTKIKVDRQRRAVVNLAELFAQ